MFHATKILKGFAHLLLLFVIVVIAIGGLLYYSWQKGLIKTTSQLEVLPTPTVNVAETANWKTYSNELYNYSLKYPPDWEMSENNGHLTLQELEENSPWIPGQLEVNVSKNQNKLTLDEWADGLDDPGEPDPDFPGIDYYSIIGNTSLGGNPAKQLSYFKFDSADIITVSIYKDYKYEITYNDGGPNDPKYELHKKVYDQILSIFRFLD